MSRVTPRDLAGYMIQGGLNPIPLTAAIDPMAVGTAILFSNFVLDQPATLASVSVTVDQANGFARVVGAGGGALVNGVDYFITSPSEITCRCNSVG